MSTIATESLAEAEQRYRARTPGSERAFREASEYLAGGISANVKFFSPYPPCMSRAEGAYMWDVDGNCYLDYLLVYGAILLGHGHPAVRDAVVRTMDDNGTVVFGTPHRGEIELARELRRLYPAGERVRFTNSGLEATLLCLRLAAAYSGRARVAKFEGHYHGSHDQVLVSYSPPLDRAGAATEPTPVPDSRGISADVLENTLVLPWNDWESTSRLLRLHAREVSGVLLEPVQGGFVPPEPGFLERLRDLTSQLGILLIFDEVKTGFRLGPGGAQGRFGVYPDLTALGKVLGGGLPVGAVIGKREVLDLARPGAGSDGLFHSGTYNGHPLVMAVGLAIIRELERPGVYQKLEDLTQDLKARIRSAGARRGVAIQTPGVGPVFGVVLAERSPRDYRDLANADTGRRRVLDLALLSEGIYSRPNDRFNLSLAHTERDVALTGEAFERAMGAVA